MLVYEAEFMGASTPGKNICIDSQVLLAMLFDCKGQKKACTVKDMAYSVDALSVPYFRGPVSGTCIDVT